jgi:hypothetical protein
MGSTRKNPPFDERTLKMGLFPFRSIAGMASIRGKAGERKIVGMAETAVILRKVEDYAGRPRDHTRKKGGGGSPIGG